MSDNDQSTTKRLALVLEATGRRHWYRKGEIFTLNALAGDTRRKRSEAGYTSIRVDRATFALLNAMRSRLPELLHEGQRELFGDSVYAPDPLTMSELMMALALGTVRLVPLEEKVHAKSRSGSRPKKVHAQSRGSASGSRSSSTRVHAQKSSPAKRRKSA